MKVIFYGGCHAAALRRIFEKFAVGVSSVAHLTSYSLIRAGKPVPYDEFLNFDAVVFSPIRNKQGYNTHQLEEHLDKAGRLRVKFPWLQWEGYHPGYQSSGRHDWYSGWWPSSLEIAARERQTFEDFVQSIYEGDLLADISLENVEKATLRFRDREFDCDVKVAQYVHENYRKSRLFLTPDHAATALYKPIATQVANLLGVKLDPAFYEMSDEIQHGIRMPILSSVRRALELEFHGGEFENKLIFRSDLLNQTEFLRLVYSADEIVVARARDLTRIYVGSERFSVPKGTVLFVRRSKESNRKGFASCSYVAGSNAPVAINALKGKTVEMWPPHWTFGRSLKPVAHDGENTTIA